MKVINMKRIWQKLMITLALNPKIKEFIQKNSYLSKISKNFVSGANSQLAIKKADQLKSLKIDTSFFNLGEYAHKPEVTEQTLLSLKNLFSKYKQNHGEIHISVDPTQMGLVHDIKYCIENMEILSKKIGKTIPGKNLIMIDMEDFDVNEDTIKIYNHLKNSGFNPGLTIQAYLRKTEYDLKTIYPQGATIRLVKGAFAEDEKNAYTNKEKIDSRFIKCVEFMLNNEYINKGSFPVFATHDHRIINRIKQIAVENKIDKNNFEFEMLFGVRPSLQKEIIQEGYKLRLYLPYGKDWWPYTIRRAGESLQNMKFILRSVF